MKFNGAEDDGQKYPEPEPTSELRGTWAEWSWDLFMARLVLQDPEFTWSSHVKPSWCGNPLWVFISAGRPSVHQTFRTPVLQSSRPSDLQVHISLAAGEQSWSPAANVLQLCWRRSRRTRTRPPRPPGSAETNQTGNRSYLFDHVYYIFIF